jgi:hypothetical protein
MGRPCRAGGVGRAGPSPGGRAVPGPDRGRGEDRPSGTGGGLDVEELLRHPRMDPRGAGSQVTDLSTRARADHCTNDRGPHSHCEGPVPCSGGTGRTTTPLVGRRTFPQVTSSCIGICTPPRPVRLPARLLARRGYAVILTRMPDSLDLQHDPSQLRGATAWAHGGQTEPARRDAHRQAAWAASPGNCCRRAARPPRSPRSSTKGRQVGQSRTSALTDRESGPREAAEPDQPRASGARRDWPDHPAGPCPTATRRPPHAGRGATSTKTDGTDRNSCASA